MTLLQTTTDPRGHLPNIFLTVLTTHEGILNKNLSIAFLVTKPFVFESSSKAFVEYPT